MRIEYHLDADDRIVAFNDHWTAFAMANDGRAVAGADVLGQSVWSYIADPGTASIYERLYQQLRRSGRRASFTFRCDSAAERRLFRMQLTPTAGGHIVVRTTEEHVGSRAPIALFDVHAARGEAMVRMCAWCHTIADARGGWVDLESAIHDMQIFHAPRPPLVTHTVCPACHAKLRAEIDALGAP